ncbi:hypothetical protein ACJX0J_018058 [Zea mays]
MNLVSTTIIGATFQLFLEKDMLEAGMQSTHGLIPNIRRGSMPRYGNAQEALTLYHEMTRLGFIVVRQIRFLEQKPTILLHVPILIDLVLNANKKLNVILHINTNLPEFFFILICCTLF